MSRNTRCRDCGHTPAYSKNCAAECECHEGPPIHKNYPGISKVKRPKWPKHNPTNKQIEVPLVIR